MSKSARARQRSAATRAPGTRTRALADDRWRVAGFVARLLVGWALAVGVLALVPGIEHWAVMSTVASVSDALRLLTVHPLVVGTTITVDQAALRIVPECTPLMPGLLLAIAMAAYPSSLRWKLAGIGAGMSLLWLYNVARMLALLGTLLWWRESFRFLHVYLWQSVTLLVVSALFLAWLRLEPERRIRA